MVSVCDTPKNRMEAQDVMQETFVKIYRNVHTFTEGHSFEGWVRRIAINTSITQYRKKPETRLPGGYR